MIIRSLSYLSLVLMLAACGAEDNSEPTFLEGSWLESDCVDYNDEETEFGHVIFTFDGLNVEVLNRVYDNSSCEGSPILEGQLNGTFKLGKEVILGSGDTVTQFLITINSVVATPYTIAKADNLNQDEYCEFSDWESNVKKPIFDCRFPEEGDNQIKEIAKVEGNQLLRGDFEQKGDDGYSIVLDVSNPFIKQ